MAIDSGTIAQTYPLPTYRFAVAVGDDTTMAFNRVSGLHYSRGQMDYRDGAGGIYRMLGMVNLLDFTLSRGIVKGKTDLWDWLTSTGDNRVDKRDVGVSLTSENASEIIVTWNILNAFPTRISVGDFDGSNNGIAIEELALSADYLSITYH